MKIDSTRRWKMDVRYYMLPVVILIPIFSIYHLLKTHGRLLSSLIDDQISFLAPTDRYGGTTQGRLLHNKLNRSPIFAAPNDATTDGGEDEKKSTEEPLNILILYGDDWTLKTLGVLNSAVKTPNLDKLASRGMLFKRNCVTTSICMISRATLYTGQYASRHKTYLPGDREMYREGAWNETLFWLLNQEGYHTGMVGKWHHPPPPKFTFNTFKNYYGKHYVTRNGITKQVTQWNEEDALEFLRTRPRDKQFALLVSFFAIHAEDFGTERYRPQNRSMSLYADDTIPTPKTASERHFNDLPYFFKNGKNFGRGRWKGRYSTPSLFQKMMKNMYRMVTEVDATCGRIIEELEEQGVADNTLIIFTTDNGNLHGEHGLAEKWFPFEESVRVPLIISDPRMHQGMKGQQNDDFTLNIDLAPTILSAANIPVPEQMQGRDLSPLYMHPGGVGDWRKEFYYEWFTGDKEAIPASLALVRKDSKYIFWPEYGYEQLFRLDDDPFEEHDLYQSNLQTDKELLEIMKARMADLGKLAAAGVPM